MDTPDNNNINLVTANIFSNIIKQYITNDNEINKIVLELQSGLKSMSSGMQDFIHQKVVRLNEIDVDLFSNEFVDGNIFAKKQIFKLQGNIILLFIKSHAKSDKCARIISVLLGNFTNKVNAVNEILEKKLESSDDNLHINDPPKNPDDGNENNIIGNQQKKDTPKKTINNGPFIPAGSIRQVDNKVFDTSKGIGSVSTNTLPDKDSTLTNKGLTRKNPSNKEQNGGSNMNKYVHEYSKYLKNIHKLNELLKKID